MKYGDKIILKSPKRIYPGLFIEAAHPDHDTAFIHYNNFNGYSGNTGWRKKAHLIPKSEWSKYISEEEFDNIMVLATSFDASTRMVAKELFYGMLTELFQKK